MYGTTLTIKELAELVRAVKEDIDDDTMSVSEYDGAGFNGEEPRPSIDNGRYTLMTNTGEQLFPNYQILLDAIKERDN